jgi:hypothetical protein
MPLQSNLFRDDPALQACLTNDRAHLTLGVSGEHVAKVHFALFATDGLAIDQDELGSKTYGPSTARAVLSYKTSRSIINRAYQSTPDNIVGKMTIASLDKDMLAKQGESAEPQQTICGGDQDSSLRRIPNVTARGVTGDAGVQRASFLPTQVGGGGGGGGPGSKSPHEKALDRITDAITAITKARAVLSILINFRPVSGGSPSLPPGTMALFDKVWRNFGPPSPLPITALGEFPQINNLKDFLTAIDSHYARMIGVLGRAASLFQTIAQTTLGATTFALTLVKPRVAGDPPGLADGIYFGDVFSNSSTDKQTEVVVHEASHFKDGHNFNDLFSASSPNWGKFDGSFGILNAWSYSMFVLDAAFNRTTPFP